MMEDTPILPQALPKDSDTDIEDTSRMDDELSSKTPKVSVDTTVMGPSLPTPQSPSDVHSSAPTVQVTQSSPVSTRRRDSDATVGTPGTPQRQSDVSEESNAGGVEQASATAQGLRSDRRRSTIDNRSNNRLSGFLSGLMRRPERDHSAPPTPLRDEQSSAHPPSQEKRLPTANIPLPPTPPTESPPPSIPPPTLQELGLSLSVLTARLSPSHFSTPPNSGAFLAPHYLLLCHAQGLDVLPLHAPPTPQPYALIRRVAFKSVVIMEERNILIAIAGRRDVVRVYTLDKVREAVEWRLEVEIRRERERIRREESKNIVVSGGVNNVFNDKLSDVGKFKERLSTSSSVTPDSSKLHRRSSNPSTPATNKAPRPVPRPPTIKKVRSQPSPKGGSNSTPAQASAPPVPSDPPPAYAPAMLRSPASVISITQSRSRRGSASDLLASNRRRSVIDRERGREGKGDWIEDSGSDEEAINVVAAGSSGSQALDERTSALASGASPPTLPGAGGRPNILDIPTSSAVPTLGRRSVGSSTAPINGIQRPRRPSDLDLTGSNTTAANTPNNLPPPSPTLLTLRQALEQLPLNPPDSANSESLRDEIGGEPDMDGDEGDDEDENVSFLDVLMASRLPDLPPPGTRLPQQPILLSSRRVASDEAGSPRESTSINIHGDARGSPSADAGRRRRRRWSVLDGVFQRGGPPGSDTETPKRPNTAGRDHSQSQAYPEHGRDTPDSAQMPATFTPGRSQSTPRGMDNHAATPSSGRSRLLNRISNALHYRSDNEVNSLRGAENDFRKSSKDLPPQTPAPKLEYVKLPGTKGALVIKSVETAKKSFLAILCGENGSKVELFAGTYRTNLTLSRTFILPDSPRLLELQLQGDDLVEVFLVFNQNIFALEPATVRVREVRIGRSERRAARRRARETRVGSSNTAPPIEEDITSVNVSIGVPRSPSNPNTLVDSALPLAAPSSMRPPSPVEDPSTLSGANGTSTPNGQPEEIITVATAQMGPYTTFQQLSFVPKFPLASIAEECIIPPTYTSFLKYREEHEAVRPTVAMPADVESDPGSFSPPGLPAPTPAAPSKWYYRDPKGVVQGPWKASLMQSWYKDGLLPVDLPVRREGEDDYILLKDLRQQCTDPTHPFRPPPPALNAAPPLTIDPTKPLLSPISLLSQAPFFGPPPLFFCSKGGHSTSIVDSKGRSVLKDRFMWSVDSDEDTSASRLGDVKRLEAFDVDHRSVLVAMRQGGLEAVDLGDALLKPADGSRQILPYFNPTPPSQSRRKPFIWKIGAPITSPMPYNTVPITPSTVTANTSLTPPKKPSLSSKSPARAEFLSREDDGDQDEVLFLGRNRDNIYFCERNAGKFRVLHLCPILPALPSNST